MLMVIAFVVLFTAVLGVAWRRVISALRVEHVSAVRKQCDQGSIQALAHAMQFLETQLRRDATSGNVMLAGATASSLSYAYNSTILPNPSLWYIVTFTRDGATGTDWIVSVTMTSSEPLLPLLP